jgi:predicted nucleotide-binding protein
MEHIEKINQLIKEAENYTFSNNCYSAEHGTYSKSSVEMQAWIAECEDFIISTYGEKSVPWKVFLRFSRDSLDGNYQDTFDEQKNIIISALSACLRITPKNSEGTKIASSKSSSRNLTQVFIVHGHDEEVKSKVARFIEKLGFEPIILHEQASLGSTIIEKIEEYSNVGFGIVLYTPCDVGGKKADSPELKSRARQNVVFEHGYLIGKIGRSNVCALVRGDIETPTDISGIVYISMDSANAWHIEIARELRSSGYNVDMNKVL